jgi:putative flavoprotein involved in K+ transport
MSHKIDTVLVGGGRTGLAMQLPLETAGTRARGIEQPHTVASAWRNHRWDSFTRNTPNWHSCLPGAESPGDDPDGFLSRDEIIVYFES